MQNKKREIIKELRWRGILKDIANDEYLDAIITNNKRFYIGIDPTAKSLHLGHYLGFIATKLITKITDMEVVFVLGGLSAQIGDPSGKNSERELISAKEIEGNVKSIRKQISSLCKSLNIEKYSFFDNFLLYQNMDLLVFFQTYGKNFNLNTMLSKESVQNRLKTGISYTEFSYQVFQSIDFLFLFEHQNVGLQIGGSDQWGNITSGIDLIKKEYGNKTPVAGLTLNLLLDENGNKIGKTNGKPIWLNKHLFSSYKLFQYLINLSDALAIDLIPKLTLIKREDFSLLLKKSAEKPEERILQHKLSELLISEIHNPKAYKLAKDLSKILFNENYLEINEKELSELRSSIPSFICKDKELLETFLIEQKILKSKREYRDFFNSEAIKLNGKLLTKKTHHLKDEDFIDGKFLILNLGKKQKVLIEKDN